MKSAVRFRPALASAGRTAVSALLALALCGCAAFEGPQLSASEHSICYTRLETGLDQLHALARQACDGGTPRFIGESLDFSACPLLVPERARFACPAA